MSRFLTKFLIIVSRLILIQVIALAIMTLLRVATFIVVPYELPATVSADNVFKAFMIGIWFDSVVSCYIMILPVVTEIILFLINREARFITQFIRIYLFIMFSLAFLISVVNIPYFSNFFENINASVYQWFAYPSITFGMLLTEKSYWGFIILAVAVCFCWWNILRHFNFTPEAQKEGDLRQKAVVAIIGACLTGLYVFGIRGRTGYNPIKISQAYFCQDPFLNQLGISPTFNMLATMVDMSKRENRKLHLMDPDEAFKEVKKMLGVGNSGEPHNHDLTRTVTKQVSVHNGKNVVIILMESMSADLLGKGDTPFLDSLSRKSIYFENAYSSGNHTNHGIYSTLYSFPAVMSRNMLKGSDVPHIQGLPDLFKHNGHTTLFYMTHESQYDNMNAFLRTNGFDVIRSQEDFPREEVVNSFGVPDNFILQYALEEMTELAKKQQPFFSVILTISNHPPFIIPEKFKTEMIAPEQAIVRYADWSLKNFFDRASKTSWFANTIFILLGDHGKLLDEKECELPQSFNHIPILIFGDEIPPSVRSDFALQIDVAPTLLGIMGWGYVQTNFGLDLNQSSRKYAFYTGDKYLAARSSDHIYLYRPSDGQEYRYIIGPEGLRRMNETDDIFSEMKKNLFALIQSAEEFQHEPPIFSVP